MFLEERPGSGRRATAGMATLVLALALVASRAASRELATVPSVAESTTATTAESLAARPRASGSNRRQPHHTVVGQLKTHAGFLSTELGNRRHLWVLLPPGYDAEPRRRYPVLYAQDGQNLFDEATAGGGEEWALDELLQARPQGIPDVIVVGVEASPQALREYAPPGSLDGARGDAYMRFLAGRVKPFVDAHYRTRPQAEHTLLCGLGEGGLVAVYGAWTLPKVFGAAIALSWEELDARSMAWAEREPRGPRVRLWIEEAASDSPRQSTTQLLALLRRGADVQVLFAGANAGIPARLAAALRFLLQP